MDIDPKSNGFHNVSFTPHSHTPEPQTSEQDQHDLQGSYIGPASGVSFLARAKKRYREDASAVPTTDSSIFAFGDAPLPQVESSFLVLPPKPEALALIAWYFDFTFPTHRYLHRPTVETWCDELYEKQMSSRCVPGERERNAIVLMAFAQATMTSPRDIKDRAIRR